MSTEIKGTPDAWKDAPDDLAERVAALLTRILSNQFDAKITVVAVKKENAA